MQPAYWAFIFSSFFPPKMILIIFHILACKFTIKVENDFILVKKNFTIQNVHSV